MNVLLGSVGFLGLNLQEDVMVVQRKEKTTGSGVIPWSIYAS